MSIHLILTEDYAYPIQVGRETRKQVEFGTYCYANSSDYQLPYWDFNV